MPEIKVGTVSDFFAHPVVAGIELSGELNTGDLIRIKGHTTDIEFVVSSMQMDNNSVTSAKAGDAVGIKVTERVRPGDIVYKVV
ncbi:MAG: translation elongation factor-like protein [Dehalococcoidales bacterium]|nr:translation elongation factor-like protein [Dehalococcoidales bacterium]